VFFPNLAEPCPLDELAEEVSLLLMINNSTSITNDAISFLTRTFAPHRTQVFQVLDVTFFGALKWHSR
jgi:hypothetical protein